MEDEYCHSMSLFFLTLLLLFYLLEPFLRGKIIAKGRILVLSIGYMGLMTVVTWLSLSLSRWALSIRCLRRTNGVLYALMVFTWFAWMDLSGAWHFHPLSLLCFRDSLLLTRFFSSISLRSSSITLFCPSGF
jgi:hypothetical protein